MTDRFLCSICGEEHVGLPTNYAYKLPDDVWAIPEPDRTARAKFTADLCKLGQRHFIRGVLWVPFSQQDGFFGWGAWTEVERPSFDRYLQLYSEDGSVEPPHAGILANALPITGSTLGTPVLVQFEDRASRPSICLKENDQSPLAVEQRNGITDVRYHEILNQIHRPH